MTSRNVLAPFLYDTWEAAHHVRENLCCFQITSGCFVRYLREAGFELGHILGAIFSLGQDFLFRNLREQV